MKSGLVAMPLFLLDDLLIQNNELETPKLKMFDNSFHNLGKRYEVAKVINIGLNL